MSKTIGANLKTHIEGETLTLAYCWKVTRQDGEIFAFTSHDKELTIDAIEYEPESGFSPSGYQQTRGINVDNLDVSAFLDSARITETDILGGLYDFASLDYFIVNYENLGDGKLYLAQGFTLGELSLKDNMFKAEIRGKAQQLTQHIIDLYGAECRATLGDAFCKVNLDNFTVYGSITEVTSRQVFKDLGRTELLDRFQYGLLTVFPAAYAEEFTHSLTNHSFETGDATGWTVEAGTPSFHSTTPDPQDGTYYVGGGTSTPECLLSQEVDLVTDGVKATIIDGGGAVFYFTAYQRDYPIGTDEGFLKIQFKNAAKTEISTQIIPTESFTTDWTLRTCSAPIPALCRYVDVELHMVMDSGPANDCYFDNCHAYTRIFKVPVPITNGGFETGDLTGWTTVSGSPAVATGTPFAPVNTGTYCLGNPSTAADAKISQELDLAALGFETAAIDNGEYEFKISWYQMSQYDNNDPAEVQVRFKDSGKSQISIEEAGLESPLAWQLREMTLSVPANTRYIDIIVYQDYLSGSYNGSWIDDLSAYAWKTDPGQGYSMEVKSYNPTTKEFTLFLPFNFELNVGDDYKVSYGCDKRLTTCLLTFINLWNYRGEPHIPGYDKAFQYP